MNSVERQTQRALADVEKIHSFLHPLGDPDPRQNLYQARSRREDAVRVTVLQMSLAVEDMLDSLFARVFVGHDPNSKRKVPKGKIFRDLEDLLERRMGFEAKLKLARLLRLITKGQQGKLDRLRSLRNVLTLGCLTLSTREEGNHGQQSASWNTRAGICST